MERFKDTSIETTLKKLTFFDLEQMIVFALDEKGKEVFIDYANNGKNCNLRCRYCHNLMIAKNGGDILRHHYAHIGGSDCKKGHEYQLPRIAKMILEKERSITLPESCISIRGPLFKSMPFDYCNIELEKYHDFDLPILRLKRFDAEDIILVIFFKRDFELINQIKKDEKIKIAIEIGLENYKGTNSIAYETLTNIFRYDTGKVWIKNPKDDPIKQKITQLASWKEFGRNKYGITVAYCPKSKDKITFIGNINSDCNSCPYSLCNIIRGNRDYYIHKGCVGYLENQFTIDEIMKADKVDYSSFKDPRILDKFETNSGDLQRYHSEQLRKMFPGKIIKVENHYNHKIVLFKFDKESDVVMRKTIKDGIPSKEYEYDSSDAFNSWHIIEEVDCF